MASYLWLGFQPGVFVVMVWCVRACLANVLVPIRCILCGGVVCKGYNVFWLRKVAMMFTTVLAWLLGQGQMHASIVSYVFYFYFVS